MFMFKDFVITTNVVYDGYRCVHEYNVDAYVAGETSGNRTAMVHVANMNYDEAYKDTSAYLYRENIPDCKELQEVMMETMKSMIKDPSVFDDTKWSVRL